MDRDKMLDKKWELLDEVFEIACREDANRATILRLLEEVYEEAYSRGFWDGQDALGERITKVIQEA